MNYYSFHIGDYRRNTHHLTCEEHYIYRTLLDTLYLKERPIPDDISEICRTLQLNGRSTDVQRVLNEFFTLGKHGWTNKRAERELKNFRLKIKQASAAGVASGKARKKKKQDQPITDERTLNGRSTKNERTLNQPIPNNQEPITNIKESTKEKASRLSEDFDMPIEWKDWAFKERPSLSLTELCEIFVTFKDYWIAKPGKDGTKLNWFSTWRNWVRREKSFNSKKSEKFDPVAYANRNNKGGTNDKPSEKDITGEVVSEQ